MTQGFFMVLLEAGSIWLLAVCAVSNGFWLVVLLELNDARTPFRTAEPIRVSACRISSASVASRGSAPVVVVVIALPFPLVVPVIRADKSAEISQRLGCWVCLDPPSLVPIRNRLVLFPKVCVIHVAKPSACDVSTGSPRRALLGSCIDLTRLIGRSF